MVKSIRRTLEEDDDYVTSTDSQIVIETLRIYGSLYIACLILYAFLRRRYTRLFNIRSWVPEQRCDIAQREYGLFSFLWEVFKVEDEELMLQCGLDALAFVRALRFGRKLTIFGMVNALWLLPLYFTAKESEETKYLSDPLVLISIANLPSSSPRFIATVIRYVK